MTACSQAGSSCGFKDTRQKENFQAKFPRSVLLIPNGIINS